MPPKIRIAGSIFCLAAKMLIILLLMRGGFLPFLYQNF